MPRYRSRRPTATARVRLQESTAAPVKATAGSATEADQSLGERSMAVERAIRSRYAPMPGLMPTDDCMPSVWVRDVYDDYAITCKGDELYRIDYTIADDGTVTLADPVRVEIAYQPVSETEVSTHPASVQPDADPASAGAPVEISESDGHILADISEAKGPKGNAWDVLLIKAGTSGNRRHYPAAMLEASVPLFEGVKAYADHPSRDEQRSRPERSIRDVVGWFEGVRWDTSEQGIRGTFKILESADWLRSALKSAWDQGKQDLLGFSINALGSVSKKLHTDGSTLIEALEKVVSTDVVTTPGAGGRLLGVLESDRQGADMDPEEIKRLIQEALASSTTSLMEAFDAKITAAVATLPKPDPKPDPEPVPTAIDGVVTEASSTPDPAATALREAQDVLKEIKAQNRRGEIAARIDAAKLPTPHTAKLKARLLEAAGRRAVDDAEVDAEVQFVRDMIAESGPARPNWSGGTVEIGDNEADQQKKALIGWFKGEAVDGISPVRDLKESFCRWTRQSFYDVSPPELFRGFLGDFDSEVHHRRVTESLSTTSWSSVFADVFYLQVVSAYREAPEYSMWRKFVSDVEGPSDFRTRHWTAIGGYGDLSLVPELGTYPELTTPTDEGSAYSLAKYGGIEAVSMEMVLGDRLNQVRQMPRQMAYAASRGLYKFVLDMITTGNPTLAWDTTALYHANHNNTGTTALSVAGVDAVNVAMRSQTARQNSNDILASRAKPRYIIVPNELESLAQRVIAPSDSYLTTVSNAGTDVTVDPARWRNANIDYHVYDYLTDATDWYAVADPALMPTMVVGFLNGRQDPELFTQDQANVGSVFTADKISYKVRFIFGGAILDYRSFFREVVAG